MEEEWKIINGYTNYSISNFGNVKNNKTLRILKPKITNRGYCAVDLGRGNGKTIHRLLGEYYIENINPDLYVEIDHIDMNKQNNKLENLRWVSKSQNQQHKLKNNNCFSIYKGVTFDKHKNKWKVSMRLNGKHKFIGYFNTEKEAGKAYNQFIIDNNLGEFNILNIL